MALKLHHKVGMVVMSLTAPRRLAKIMLRPYPQPMTGSPEVPAELEPVAFPIAGGLTCRGWWIMPRSDARRDACVVVAHGWTSHGLRMQHLLEPILALGFPVLLYHARSHGDSDPYPICSLVQFTEDLRAAVEFARGRASRVGVVGHSLGAAAALVATADGAPVEAVVSLAAPAHPAEASMDILRTEGMNAERVFRRIGSHVEEMIGRRFETIAPERRVREIACPLLLIHGTADEVIPVSHFHRIRAGAGANVEAHVLEGANHDEVKTAAGTLAHIQAFLTRAIPADGEGLPS